jgi:drug/metabolite transporter (DMT)-like permease
MRPVYRRAPRAWNHDEWTAFAAAAFAVVLWGVLPLLRGAIDQVPPLLTTAVALGCAALAETLRGWLAELARPAAARATGSASLPAGRGLVLSATLVGAIGFYFVGLDWAPPAQVTLVTYVWPLMFVAASEVLTFGRVRGVVLAGCAVAFAGSAVLVTAGADGGAARAHGLGYAAGLASGLCWVVYSLALRRGPTLGPGAWPQLFTLAAVFAAALHAALEPAAALGAGTLAVCAVIGTGPYGLAFVAWAYGVRRGPARTVGALAYAVPFVAAGALVLVGGVQPSWQLAVGGATVVAGVVLANRRAATT